MNDVKICPICQAWHSYPSNECVQCDFDLKYPNSKQNNKSDQIHLFGIDNFSGVEVNIAKIKQLSLDEQFNGLKNTVKLHPNIMEKAIDLHLKLIKETLIEEAIKYKDNLDQQYAVVLERLGFNNEKT